MSRERKVLVKPEKTQAFSLNTLIKIVISKKKKEE